MLVEKVNYQIDWAKFSVGSSFFIPCLNPVKARDEILPVLRRLKYEVVHKVVIEDGVQGIRVWRLPTPPTGNAGLLRRGLKGV
jgi:hypothetical protein